MFLLLFDWPKSNQKALTKFKLARLLPDSNMNFAKENMNGFFCFTLTFYLI